MAMILLNEYAKKHGRHPSTVIRKVKRGTLKTAKKIGWQWFIDEDEPYIDHRIKSGKYVGWRKYGRSGKPEED